MNRLSLSDMTIDDEILSDEELHHHKTPTSTKRRHEQATSSGKGKKSKSSTDEWVKNRIEELVREAELSKAEITKPAGKGISPMR